MNEYEFTNELRDNFIKAFPAIADNEGNPVEGYEVPTYWEDTIGKLADSAVPIYPHAMYELWMALGRPEVDDEDMVEGITDIDELVEGVTDIDELVAIGIYKYAYMALSELAREFGLDQ